MATGKITKRAVDSIAAPAKGDARTYLWDEEVKGFGLMVTGKDHRSYILQYRIGGRGGQTRRVTIGQHGSPWTPDTARKRALELLEQVRRSIDPFDAERARIEAQRERQRLAAEAEAVATTLAFSRFADRFIDRYAKIEQSKTWRDTDSIFRRDLKPHFGDKPLPSIRPAEIVHLLEKVQERGDSAAIKAYKALRVMFEWAVQKHQLVTSPMQNMKPPAKIAPRERALTDGEVRLVWKGASALGWPTAETKPMWLEFVYGFVPSDNRVWDHRPYFAQVEWLGPPLPAGSPVGVHEHQGQAAVLSADGLLVGWLQTVPPNPDRKGVIRASVSETPGQIDLTYLGPDDLWQA